MDCRDCCVFLELFFLEDPKEQRNGFSDYPQRTDRTMSSRSGFPSMLFFHSNLSPEYQNVEIIKPVLSGFLAVIIHEPLRRNSAGTTQSHVFGSWLQHRFRYLLTIRFTLD